MKILDSYCFILCFCFYWLLLSVPTCETADTPPVPLLDLEEMGYDVGEIPQEGASTMAFVFDVTGSMYDDLVQVIDGAAKILNTVLQRRERLLHNYVLVPFHDPEFGPATVTTDHRLFQLHLQELYVQGGGDCPEATIAAIKLALEVCLPNSFIYVFTDASSKDYHLLQDVLTLIQRKQSQVVFVMTGDCGNASHPGYQAYETIASTSSGQVFHLKKSDVDEVLNFVRVSLQARKVNLLAVNQDSEGESLLPIVVDSNLREFTVSLSGDNPQVKLINPRGGSVDKAEGVKELLNISNVQIVNVKDPEHGTWNVHLSSNSSHTVRATGLSPIDFVYGFSTLPTSNLQETYHRPLKGAPNHLIINATDLAPKAYFDFVEFINLTGDSLLKVPVNRIPHMSGMFNATAFVPPDEYFYLKIHGFDELNLPMERISPTAISSQLPAVPEVTLQPPTDTHYGNTITLICQIQSLVPFSVQWFRGINATEQLGETGNFSQTSTVNLTITNITKEDEHYYYCNATNIAGPSSSHIYLDVREPPPRIRKLRDVSIVPGSSAAFDCSAVSDSPFNLTWNRYDPGTTKRRFTAELIRLNPRFKDFGNGTLLIRDAKKEDEGWYRCTARNEGGPAHQRMYLSVHKPPSITIHPKTDISYTEGSNMIITCEGTGIPEPTVEWIRDDQLIPESQHIRAFRGTLQLYRATQQQAGEYECRAQNAAGSDRKSVFLKYIEPPKIDKSHDIYKVILGDIATLACKVKVGIPAAMVQWKRGSNEIPKRKAPLRRIQNIRRGDLPIEDEYADIYEFDDDKFELVNQSLLRFRPETTDVGEYICEASNEAGSDQHIVTVVVLVPPSIFSSEENVIVNRGQTLSLPCWTTGSPTPVVTWLKDGQAVSMMQDQSLDPNANTESTSDDNRGNMIVTNVDLSTAGFYTCVATNEAGQATKNYTVIVHDPPKINDSNPKHIEAIDGQDTLLSCQASGHPPPVISWQKYGVRLDPATLFLHRNGSMLIRSVQPNDAGLYTCTASNEAGYDDMDINVSVLVPPYVNWNTLKNRTEIVVGHSVTLECPVHAFPRPNISWVKSDEIVNEHTGKENRFFIRNHGLSLFIVKAQLVDAGNYVCIAANAAGKTMATLTLDVLAPPTFVSANFNADIKVMENDPLHLDCWTAGTPTPNVTWTRDDQHLIPNKNLIITDWQLRIHKIQEHEAGTYTCHASNIVGRTERRFNVDVFVSPKLDDVDSEIVQVPEGRPAELSCNVKGNPIPAIVWLKENIQLDPGADANIAFKNLNRVLHLGNVSTTDAGKYVCEAHNEAGSVNKSILLDVMVTPLIRIQGVNTAGVSKVLKNEKFEAECTAKGNPLPSLSWVKDGIIVVESPQSNLKLRVEYADVSDAGTYTCIARNLAGHSEKDINIEVLVPPHFVKQGNQSGQPELRQVLAKLPVILECPAEGKPVPEIRWLKNGIPFNVVSDNNVVIFDGGKRLRIALATPEDGGHYMCIATNEAGQAEKEFNLDVLVAPKISQPMRGVDIDYSANKALLHGELIIHCPASGNPQPIITWFKNGARLDAQSQLNMRFEENFQKLIVTRVRGEDEGRYTCVATNAAGSAEKSFQVDVQFPPEFEIPIDKMDLFPAVQVNRSITLHCPAVGRPAPSILWLRKGKVVQVDNKNMIISSDGRKLKILHAQDEDRGSYSCVAYNEAGEIKLDFELSIQIPPKVELGKVQPKVTVKENDSITVECPVTGYPLPTITWLKDGKVLSLTEKLDKIKFKDNYRLLIINHANEEDDGQYTCVASNEAGVTEQNFKVNVHVPPKMDSKEINHKPNVMMNRPLMIICPVVGNPPPTLAWFKNGQPLHRMGDPNLILSADGRRLKLRRARPEDAGLYKCVAYNDVGKTEQEFEIIVQVPPIFQSNGNDTGAENRIPEAIEGTIAEIQCEVLGIPKPTVIWLKDGRLVGLLENEYEDEISALEGNEINELEGESSSSHIEIMHDGQLLRIHSIQKKDEGRYTCIASNVVGMAEKNFDLEILVPPKIYGSKREQLKVYINRPVILECLVEANPPADIKWFKGIHELNSELSGGAFMRLTDGGHRLQITQSLPKDSGEYTCIAINSVGQAEKYFELTVLVPPTVTIHNPKAAITISAGHNITLECQAKGNPPPEFFWLKDGVVIEDIEAMDIAFEANSQHLRLKNVTVDHTGRYTCLASNEAGTNGKDISLTVIAPPRMVQLPAHQYSPLAMINQPITLECPVASNTEAKIKWFKNGDKVDTSNDPFVRVMSDGKALQIFRARPEDAGMYRCLVSNMAGETNSEFHLQVLVPPKIDSPIADEGGPSIVMEHDTVDFECYASGNPYPVVSWLKDGVVLDNSRFQILSENQHLHIPNAEIADTGQYTCIATSSSGSSQRDFYLTIQVPPQIDPSAPKNITVISPLPVILHCPIIKGDPEPTITWMKQGLYLNSYTDQNIEVMNKGHELHIKRSKLSDAGNYICLASNSAGTDNASIALDVHVSPKINRANFGGTASAILKSTLLLECPASGHPQPKINWYKDNLPLNSVQSSNNSEDVNSLILNTDMSNNVNSFQTSSEGRMLQITRIELNQEGIYKCVAVNSAGTDSAQHHVDVLLPPRVDSAINTRLNVTEGEAISLPCPVTGDPVPNAIWFKDGEIFDPIHQPNWDWTGKHRNGQQSSLHLLKAQGSDSGRYTCFATNHAGDVEVDIDLDVLVPPSIIPTPAEPDVHILEGSSLILECQPRGNPLPIIAWFINGSTISDTIKSTDGLAFHLSDSNHRLRLDDARSQNSGQYMCVAKNPVGKAEHNFNVKVLAPPRFNSSSFESNYTAVLNDDVTLACPVSGVPQPRILWSKESQLLLNGGHLVTENGGTYLKLTKVRLSDKGRYVCLATNEAGTSEANINLDVLVPPTIDGAANENELKSVIMHQPMTLECNARGVPHPVVNWYKDDEPLLEDYSGHVVLSEDRQSLEIVRSIPQDEGVYTCMAENDAGTAEMAYQLDVLVPPGINLPQPLQTLQVVTGRPLKIECPVVGDPPPLVTWLKKGQPVIATDHLAILKDSQVIYVESASPTDAGDYTCLASNEAGNTEQEFIVLIQVPPKIKNDDIVENVSTVAYHPFRLECPASGNPFPEIKWKKGGHFLNISTPALSNSYVMRWIPGPALQVNRALTNHSGIYICEATNAAGSAQKSYNVSVWRPPRFLSEYPIHQEISSNTRHNLTLSCLSEGYPIPQTAWFKDGQLLLSTSNQNIFRHDGQELFLQNLTVADSGQYRCMTINVAGNTSKDFTLNVMEPPTITNAPNAYIRIKLNKRLDLPCQATGNPIPRITWSRAGSSFSETGSGHYFESLDSTLTFPTVRLQNEGTYTCTATNDAGTANYTVTVEVQVPPSIASAPSQLAVNRALPVTLPCVVKGRPNPTVTWKKDSELINASLGYSFLPSGSLSINSANLLHAGMYTCMAYNDAGTVQAQRYLRVDVPPRIAPDQPEKYAVIRGEDAILNCLTDGLPAPNTVWERNGETINIQHPIYALLSDGELYISSVGSLDSGTYRCVVQNTAGTDYRDVELLVMIPPKIQQDSSGSRYVVTKGSPLRLPCRATGYPLPDIHWRKDGIHVFPNTSEDLYISEAQVEDSGKYVCMAVNRAGRDHAERTVEVIIPPTIVSPPAALQKPLGEEAQFMCIVEGVPPPNVTWWHDTGPVLGSVSSSNGKSVLTLKMIQLEDAGVYTCVAKNAGGKKHAEAQLIVLVPPKIVRSPEDFAILLGSSITLPCDAEGDPYPSIIWTKDGQKLEPSQGNGTKVEGWFLIEDAKPTDAGAYKCIATNSAGVAEVVGVITVLVVPQMLSKPRDTVIDLGSSSVLDCRADGNPQPTIKWTKDGIRINGTDKQKVLMANSSLHLVAVQLSDEGLYECIATNTLGNVSSTAKISIRVHGSWSSWNAWGQCSVSCGQGIQTRQRLCNNPAPRHNGQTCIGPVYENQGCLEKPCPVNGSWSQWLEWTKCSVTCGRGIRRRARMCNAPAPSAGGRFCLGSSRETETCFTKECPVDGNWGEWTGWSTCSASCGEGLRTRSRLCDRPPPKHGGRECEGPSTEKESCNTIPCEVDGKWGPWTEWSQCSQSCGGGMRERRRACDSPAPSNGGRNCSGQATLIDYCHNDPCPVHGKWASWSEWGECSASCNGGLRRRFRTCSNPAPNFGGRSCAGPAQDTEACNAHQCPEHGNWAPWSEWTPCSVSCAGGVRKRYRSCTNPPPRFGGRRCSGDDSQQEQCALYPCQGLPVNAVGNLLGVINGQDIGLSPIFVNTTQTGEKTTVVATIGNIPYEVGNLLRVVPSLLSPVYWAMAYEMDQAANGYRLTKGYFLRDSQVTFTTGEEVRMTFVARGFDSSGNFLVDAVISGDVPDLPVDEDIILDEYTEDYIQTGPDTLHAMSTRTFSVNGYPLPYAWNHSIRYDETNGRMPYLVQQLHVDGIGVDYNAPKSELNFIVSAAIGKGSPSNKCPNGFSLHINGFFCDDTNECLVKNPCSHGCSNTPGSYSCFCPPGYLLGTDGHNCQDLDECMLGMDNCLPTTECENTIGSYHCLSMCRPGFQRTISGLGCQDINECSEQPQVCDQLCLNLIGGYRCDCTRGYRLIGKSTCIDIDECEQVRKPCSHRCVNIPGSYICSCPTGYNLIENRYCEDINECLNGNYNCQIRQECQNTPGSFRCVDLCQIGYSLHINGSCVDNDECQDGQAVCHLTQVCENTVGSYRCICPRGYQSSSSGQPCQDYNECASDEWCQHHCENTIGSYKCICPDGYELNNNGRTCQDIDECTEEKVNCGRDKICFNTRGSFQCIDAPCPPLYDRDQLTEDCVLPCDRSDIPCAPGVKYAEILSYKMVSLPSGIRAYQDLVRLVAYDQNGQPLQNTEFSIVENNSGVPFQIRRENGKGILYALKPLDARREYSAVVLATSYDPFRTVVHYTTKFLVYISVAEFPY